MRSYILLLGLLLPLSACCQWTISLTKNDKPVTRITPFITVDTGDIVAFAVSAPASIPVESVLQSLKAHLCVQQSQEQSLPDSIVEMLPDLEKEINRGDLGYGLTHKGNTNTWLFKFKIGDLSDCNGQIIWLKFVADRRRVPQGPAEAMYQFFIKP